MWHYPRMMARLSVHFARTAGASTLLALVVVALPCAQAPANSLGEPQRVSLWAGGAPGSEARRHEPEQAKDWWVKNIHDPSITIWLPPQD
jgi:hypothetical protein